MKNMAWPFCLLIISSFISAQAATLVQFADEASFDYVVYERAVNPQEDPKAQLAAVTSYIELIEKPIELGESLGQQNRVPLLGEVVFEIIRDKEKHLPGLYLIQQKTTMEQLIEIRKGTLPDLYFAARTKGKVKWFNDQKGYGRSVFAMLSIDDASTYLLVPAELEKLIEEALVKTDKVSVVVRSITDGKKSCLSIIR